VKRLVLVAIRTYQAHISAGTPPSCRYLPTCSQFGFEAVHRYGLAKGGWLTLRRLLRCHPFVAGGYDPVP
jgi:hypothetical protein